MPKVRSAEARRRLDALLAVVQNQLDDDALARECDSIPSGQILMRLKKLGESDPEQRLKSLLERVQATRSGILSSCRKGKKDKKEPAPQPEHMRHGVEVSEVDDDSRDDLVAARTRR